MVEDLISHLFPNMKVYRSYDLASRKVDVLESQLQKKYGDLIARVVPIDVSELRALKESSLENIYECDGNCYKSCYF